MEDADVIGQVTVNIEFSVVNLLAISKLRDS